MCIVILLLGVSLGAEVLLTLQPKRCVFLISFCIFLLSVALSLLCICYRWVALLLTGLCLVLGPIQFHVLKVLPITAVLGASAVLLLTPRAQELLYLDSRYAGQFVYLSAGIYYSTALDKNILVDLKEGDTYQSVLYGPHIVAEYTAKIPPYVEVRYAYTEPQRTTYLAPSYTAYITLVHPTVYIGVWVSETAEWVPDLPSNCIVEILSE